MQKKLTVIEMAEYLGVSKEAIYNRIRRGTLQSVMEDGKKYIILTDEIKKESSKPKRQRNTNSFESEYVELLKSQIEELKSKNQKLEEDKERLLEDKEKMLIESKEKIEQVYKERDEQLKAILTLANVPSLQNKANSEVSSMDVVEEIDITQEYEQEDIVEKMCESFEDWQELRAFLDDKGYSKDDRKQIKKQVKKKLGKDDKIKENADGTIYIKKDTKLKHIIGKAKS